MTMDEDKLWQSFLWRPHPIYFTYLMCSVTPLTHYLHYVWWRVWTSISEEPWASSSTAREPNRRTSGGCRSFARNRQTHKAKITQLYAHINTHHHHQSLFKITLVFLCFSTPLFFPLSSSSLVPLRRCSLQIQRQLSNPLCEECWDACAALHQHSKYMQGISSPVLLYMHTVCVYVCLPLRPSPPPPSSPIYQSADWSHSPPAGSLPRGWYTVSLYTHKQLLIGQRTPKAFHYPGVNVIKNVMWFWACGTRGRRLIQATFLAGKLLKYLPPTMKWLQ